MNIAPSIIEISLGTSLALIFCMSIAQIAYLIRLRRVMGHNGRFYNAGMAAIALLLTFGGFFLRSAPIYVLRHAQNHGTILNLNRYDTISQALVIAGTVIFVIGGAWWMRIISPAVQWFPLWIAIVCLCLAFGVGMGT